MGLDQIDRLDPITSLPHGYPFVLFDRVVELSASKGVGIKNVSGNTFFSGGRPDEALFLPDVLLIEAMAQLSGLVMNFGGGGKTAAALAAISTMRFVRRAVAGESISITSMIESSLGSAASFDVVASVGAVAIASGRLTLARFAVEAPSRQAVFETHTR